MIDKEVLDGYNSIVEVEIMKLQVEQARKEEGQQFPFSFALEAALLGGVDAFPWKTHDVVVHGSYWFDGQYTVIEGIIETDGTYVCSRCLTPVSVNRVESFKEKYGEGDDLPDDVLPYNGEYIDLTDTVREVLILSEPMQVLCRPDCKGLCPQCGANLNDGPCSCPTDHIDPRLAVLGDLLKSKN